MLEFVFNEGLPVLIILEKRVGRSYGTTMVISRRYEWRSGFFTETRIRIAWRGKIWQARLFATHRLLAVLS